MSMFEWLSYGETPVDTSRPEPVDNNLTIGAEAAGKREDDVAMDSTGVDSAGWCVIAVQEKENRECILVLFLYSVLCNCFVSQGRGGVSLLTWLCDLTNLRMMMKKLIYMAVLLFAVIAVKAQDYEAFNKFMRDYSKGWMTDYRKPAGNTMETIKQVGEPAPNFILIKS